MSCTWNGQDLTLGNALTVYDGQPVITSIVHFYGGDPVFTAGEGQVGVQINGNNLGMGGLIAVVDGSDVTVAINPDTGQQWINRWSPEVIAVVFNIAPAAAPRDYTVTVMPGIGDGGAPFLLRAGDPPEKKKNTGKMHVVCPTPTVRINRPLPDLSPAEGSPAEGSTVYQVTLTAVGTPAGGTYEWSSPDNITYVNGMEGTTLTIHTINPGKYTLNVTYTLPCGGTATDTLSFVLAPDVTVMAWVDPNAIKPILDAVGPQASLAARV
jgi:hypothetical protein